MDQHALKVAAQNLIELMAQLKQGLLDHRLAISGFRPLSDSQPATRAIHPARLSESELSRLADQVCDLWISDKPSIHAAVLVCNEVAVLEMINQVNQAKTDLCHQIDRVKKQLFVEQERRVNPQASDLFLDAMSLARSEFLNKNRDNRFNAMVAKMGFAAMDFTKARKAIRQLPAHTQQLSYTWAKNHSRVRPLSTKSLMALAQHYQREGDEERAQRLLTGLAGHHSASLYRVHFNAPTLRINYKTTQGHENTQAVWQSCLGAGITWVPSSEPLSINWTPRPCEREAELVQQAWLQKSKLVEVDFAPRMQLYVKV